MLIQEHSFCKFFGPEKKYFHDGNVIFLLNKVMHFFMSLLTFDSQLLLLQIQTPKETLLSERTVMTPQSSLWGYRALEDALSQRLAVS